MAIKRGGAMVLDELTTTWDLSPKLQAKHLRGWLRYAPPVYTDVVRWDGWGVERAGDVVTITAKRWRNEEHRQTVDAAPHPVAELVSTELPGKRYRTAFHCEDGWQGLARELHGRLLALTTPAGTAPQVAPPRAKRQGGPTVKTEMRARAIRSIVDEHPDWSQVQVAMMAADRLQDNDMANADALRNALRGMGWTWKGIHAASKDQ